MPNERRKKDQARKNREIAKAKRRHPSYEPPKRKKR